MNHLSVSPNPWYASPEAVELLSKTNDGMFCFVWEAEHDDGTIVRQFDDVVFQRALTDPDFKIPSESYARRSVDILDRSKIKRFTLIPTAPARKAILHFRSVVFSVQPNLDEGEKFFSHWLTDRSEKTGVILRRTVIGIERKDGERKLQVISPSGVVFEGSDENQSFEGE